MTSYLAMKFKMTLMFVLLFALASYGQQDTIGWINKNAYELKTDSFSTDHDLQFLSKELKDKTVVGFGEASHGTHEFFIQKARIIKYLIRECDFKLVSFEMPYSFSMSVNKYLQDGQGNLRALMQPMVLYNTEEIYALFQWIRQYNKSKSSKNKVVLTGVDNEEFWGNSLTRDKLMAENFIKSYESKKHKAIIWTHNVHIAKDVTMAEFPAMGSHLKQQFGEKFYVVGFDTYKGTVNVLNGTEFEAHAFEGEERSFSKTLAKAAFEAFFLSFHKKANPFTGTTGLITNIYSDWRKTTPLPFKPGIDFDAIIFIRNTSASIKLREE